MISMVSNTEPEKQEIDTDKPNVSSMIGSWTMFAIMCVIFLGVIQDGWWRWIILLVFLSGAIQRTAAYMSDVSERNKNSQYAQPSIVPKSDGGTKNHQYTSVEKIFCPSCGAEVTENIKICSNCGFQL